MKCLKYLLTLILLQSCSLAPRYVEPSVDAPEEWRLEANLDSTVANIRWWEQLNDPVLDRLIQEALEYNNDIKIAIYNVRQFYANLEIVSSQLYPQIFGNGLATKTEIPLALTPGVTGIRRITDDFRLNVNMLFELDLWGKLRSESDAALAELYAQQEAQKSVVLAIVTGVANAYILLREFDRDLQISRDTLKSRQESFNLAVLRYEEGLTSELEVRQAESEVLNAAARMVDFELLIAKQENLISILVGHAPDYVERGLAIDQWSLPPEIPVGLPSELLLSRPDILQAEQNIRAANAEIGVARANFFPNITLTGFYGYESLELHNLISSLARTWQYGVILLQSIFRGGKLDGELDFAIAAKCQAYYEYEAVVLNAFKEVDNALVSHQTAREQREIQQKRVSVLKEYLSLATLQYDNGQTDYLNVLDAERNLFAAQLDFASAESDVFTTLIDIYKSVGGGWVIDANSQVCAQ